MLDVDQTSDNLNTTVNFVLKSASFSYCSIKNLLLKIHEIHRKTTALKSLFNKIAAPQACIKDRLDFYLISNFTHSEVFDIFNCKFPLKLCCQIDDNSNFMAKTAI